MVKFANLELDANNNNAGISLCGPPKSPLPNLISTSGNSTKGFTTAQIPDNSEGGSACSKRIKRFLKMALPHVALYFLLFWYLMAGAWAFASMENQAEREQTAKKLERISEIYKEISEQMANECGVTESREEFDRQLYSSLSRISQFMEKKDFNMLPNFDSDLQTPSKIDELLPPKWNVMSSILYALSILTTTGYGSATPMTPFGQWFSIGYGLLGIPLMILAAVDIGRFLSDVVLTSYTRIERTKKKISSFFGFNRKKNSVIMQVETKALKVLHNTRRRSISRRLKKDDEKLENGEIGNGLKNQGEKSFSEKLDAKNEKKARKAALKKRLPLWVNAAILLLFCMLGGIVYVAACGNEKSFIEGFFVTFNLVANLTMSEMPTDISHLLTIVYIFIFVTFGLAVLSMCADLAASELKWIFLKIHYFGRKINWKRKGSAKKDEQMEIEVKELLKIINQIRVKYPNKEQITSFDILKYVQELNDGAFHNGYNPYRTFNVFLMQQHRRDTIAFMPQSIEGLKFADEIVEDLDEGFNYNVIRGSVGSPPLSNNGSPTITTTLNPLSTSETLTNIYWHRSNPNTFIPFIPTLFSRE